MPGDEVSLVGRRRSLVTVTIDLYGGSRAAVVFTPVRGRWPDRRGSDRLTIPVCVAALALAEADGVAGHRVTAMLRRAAGALVIDDAPPEDDRIERVCGLRLEAEDGVAGWPRIVIRVGSMRGAPVATVHGPHPSLIAMGTAATVVTGALLAGAESDLRLAGALALEGLLLYHREVGDQAHGPARAAAYSLGYAAARLKEASHPVPDDLLNAAGGAQPMR